MHTLEDLLPSIWQQLATAHKDTKHPFRFGVLGTSDKNTINMRTVVIREVILTEFEIWFYTDIRTPKVTEIRNNNHITWLFYHPIDQTQIRLYGNAEILHNTKINQTVWQNLPDYGKTDYLTKQPPGSVHDQDFHELTTASIPQNFGIVKTKIQTIDWLQLSRSGHLRAKFERNAMDWRGEWLVP